MTHDELLAKIDEELATDYADSCGNFPIGLNALRAIIELHKPQNKHEVEFGLAKCDGCYLSYPCNTIQAIEKELG